MSRRFPNQMSNPVRRYFSWKGGKDAGHVVYYDKDQQKEVIVPLPFVFMPLDMLSCITGFNKQAEESIYSNEVRNTQKEILNVRMGHQTIAQGKYQDIKDTVVARGGKFTSSVYIAYKNDSGNLEIGNIKFKGSSLSPWIDLQNGNVDLSEKAVVIADSKLDNSGSIAFQYPVFKTKEISQQTDEQADSLYDEISTYLGQKKTHPVEEEQDKAESQDNDDDLAGSLYGDSSPKSYTDPSPEIDEDLPF